MPTIELADNWRELANLAALLARNLRQSPVSPVPLGDGELVWRWRPQATTRRRACKRARTRLPHHPPYRYRQIRCPNTDRSQSSAGGFTATVKPLSVPSQAHNQSRCHAGSAYVRAAPKYLSERRRHASATRARFHRIWKSQFSALVLGAMCLQCA